MKIVIIGGTGIIGSGIAELLKKEHEVIVVGKTHGDYQIDLLDTQSIKQLFNDIDNIDGVIERYLYSLIKY